MKRKTTTSDAASDAKRTDTLVSSKILITLATTTT